MVKKILILTLLLPAAFLGGCLPRTDTLSIRISWPSLDCDVGIMEPDNIQYFSDDGYSPNGYFSTDLQNGGTETWTLDRYHRIGKYLPLVYSWDYEGSITVTITANGLSGSTTEYITPEELLQFLDYDVTRSGPRGVLSYKLVRTTIQRPPK